MSFLVRYFYRFGPFDLDAEQRLVRRDGVKIALPPKAFDVLLYMVRNPLRLITKEELLQAVWPDSFVEEGNLTQNIFLLRKALAGGRDDFRYIVTIPGRGYQFASAVETVTGSPQDHDVTGLTKLANDSGSMELSSVRSTMRIVVHEEIDDANSAVPVEGARAALPGSSGWAWGRWTWSRSLAGAAILILAFASSWFFLLRRERKPRSSQTIVVADFNNRTGDRTFDDVLKEALEIDLAQSPYMDVMSDQEALNILQLMGKQADTALTPDVAREACQRSNRQVLVSGSIANVGGDYLLAIEATDCVSGKKLAEAKAEAVSKEKVLAALDRTADRIRSGLGESAKSVKEYEVPIAQATTSSLEALKAYSIGEYMVGRSGKEETETLPLFQRAVELDPQFAMAYAAIATDYYNLNEYKLAAPYYQKAFDLSDHASQKERLYIRAHYYADSVKDVEQGIKEYQLWAATYPRDWGPWLDIAKEYTELGQYAPAIAAGEQAMRLDQSRGVIYTELARAYMRVNRFADAKRTALGAVSIGKDSYGLHAILFEIAFVEHDRAAMAREVAWSKGRPSEWSSLYVQAFAAGTEGRYKRAQELFHTAYSITQRENLTESGDEMLIDQATMEFQLGLPDAARNTLRRVKQPDVGHPDIAFLKTELGDIAFGEHFLGLDSSTDHPGTLMTFVYLPRVRAEIALQRAKPLDAIGDLEPTASYEQADGFTVFAQRGEGYTRAGQTEKAAAEYKQILAHQGLDPISPMFPLAHLWLGRTDRQMGRTQESKAEYEKFFAQWKDADKDLPMLLAARREYAALGATR